MMDTLSIVDEQRLKEANAPLEKGYLGYMHAANLDMALLLQQMATPSADRQADGRAAIASLRNQARWLTRAAALWQESLKPLDQTL